MIIKILGSGCPSCRRLEENTRLALVEADMTATIVKVTDVAAIIEHGVMKTPALVIDDTVRASGRILSVAEIKNLLLDN